MAATDTSEATGTETAAAPAPRRVLVTGAGGYLGKLVVRALAADARFADVVATDLHAPEGVPGGVASEPLDVADGAAVDALVARHRPDAIVHLAAIVTPPKGGVGRERARRVDVDGTRHVLEACLAHGVGQVVVTSSGAAYGYHADNAPRLTEDMPLRGNDVFAYAHHKRLVEELLATWRVEHPEVKQLVFRPGTILGRTTRNQITAIFERPVVVGLRGVASPFVFIWDEDVVACVVQGVAEGREGVYNLAGDGVMTLREIAHALGKPFVAVPPRAMRAALGLLERLHIGPYGPEQVMFLEHRPVLANDRLREELGYVPRASRDVFASWAAAHA
ncbi:MAG: NAD-dependent epimerase/dehydratase family protein [Myxococcales bacterium]|nr:NAD-dependent epimerase/dehydratase family protein [Myxococcales bacterium]